MGIYVDFMFNHPPYPAFFSKNIQEKCVTISNICEFLTCYTDENSNSRQHFYNNTIFHKATDSDTKINFHIIACQNVKMFFLCSFLFSDRVDFK